MAQCKRKSICLSFLAVSAVLFTFFKVTYAQNSPKHYSLLWAQTAAEHKAVYLQTYQVAEILLDVALEDKKWTALIEQDKNYSKLVPAIILDVDETVLDNSHFDGEMVKSQAFFQKQSWDSWVAMAQAKAVPGVVSFIQNARKKGIQILFLTNRQCRSRSENTSDCPQELDTINNLKKIGIDGVDPDHILLQKEKPGWSYEKEIRRTEIGKSYRVLMIFGDDLGDFVSGVKGDILAEERIEVMYLHQQKWGRKWFMLPNPNYGSWYRVLPEPREKCLKGINE